MEIYICLNNGHKWVGSYQEKLTLVIFIDARVSNAHPSIKRPWPKWSTIPSWSCYIHVLVHL